MNDTDLKIPSIHDVDALVGILLLVASDPEGIARRVAEFKAAADEARDLITQANNETSALALRRAEHAQAMDGLSAKQQAEHEARLREAQRLMAAAETLNREADEKLQRAHDVMHAAEMRSADLSNRLHGIGAK
jgi:hypothetical protein